MNHIKEALSNIIQGNLDEMRQNFKTALMEKAVQHLEEKKIDIAQSYFAQLDEQELSSATAYQMGRGVEMIAKKPFGRPGFNMAGRSAATGTVTGKVPGIGGPGLGQTAKITANRVDAPGGYSQATVDVRNPSGSPIGTARMDASGARMTSIAGRRVNESEDKDEDDKNEREMSPAIMPKKKKMIARKMMKKD